MNKVKVKTGTRMSNAELSLLTAPLVDSIPMDAGYVERHKQLGQILDEQSEDIRLHLRNYMHSHLKLMLQEGASDMDLGGQGCAGKIWFRTQGHKGPLEADGPLSLEATDFLCHNMLMPEQRKILLKEKNLDFSYSLETNNGNRPQRYRADMYFDLDHLALNVRLINPEIRSFKELGLHPTVAQSLSVQYQKSGLVLITGISGAGKSSTLDTIIDANNKTAAAHIVIIASPVELIHTPQKSIVRHREVGRDVRSFKDGAIEALRQDPDIIVLGELRDPETVVTALEVADSGHKTFSTLHTASAIESIDRIVGEMPTDEQNRVRNRLADVLTAVISQKLVRTKEGRLHLCKEVLLNTPSVKAAIRNNNTGDIYQILQESGDSGMHTLEQDLKRAVDKGIITQKEALNQANNKKRLSQLINYIE